VKERPILFSGEMVRAILEGRKTQTRRVVKPVQSEPKIPPLTMEPWMMYGEQEVDDDGRPMWEGYHPDYPYDAKWFTCPYGKVGDRLWVRETFWTAGEIPNLPTVYADDYIKTPNGYASVVYRADGGYEDGAWKPSIFMPRWASRILLEIVAVRVERVQDISERDAHAEGLGMSPMLPHPRAWFRDLWNSINAKRGYSWESDPYVWVVEFRNVATSAARSGEAGEG
jgi:hypothetical protein